MLSAVFGLLISASAFAYGVWLLRRGPFRGQEHREALHGSLGPDHVARVERTSRLLAKFSIVLGALGILLNLWALVRNANQ